MTDGTDWPDPAEVLSPFACRRRLRFMLASLREQRRQTVAMLASAMAWPPSTVLRYESSGVLDLDAEQALAGHYALTGVDAENFRAAAAGARRPEWWDEFASSLDSGARHLLDHENAARAIRLYDTRIPALLQTAERYRAAPSFPLIPGAGEDVAERIHSRRRLAATSARPRLHAVLDEAALWRAVGGMAVHLAQLDYLIELGQAGSVTIVVVPLAHGAHHAIATPSFVLFDLPPADPQATDSDVVRGQMNTLNIPVMRAETGWVRDGEALFSDVCRAALGPDASGKAIAHVRARLADGGGYAPIPTL